MKKKVIRLTESDVENLVKKIIKEDDRQYRQKRESNPNMFINANFNTSPEGRIIGKTFTNGKRKYPVEGYDYSEKSETGNIKDNKVKLFTDLTSITLTYQDIEDLLKGKEINSDHGMIKLI